MVRTVLALSTFVALAAASGWWYFVGRVDPEPGLIVEEPDRVLEGVPAVRGKKHPIEYRVINRTRQTLRVVGADYG